MRHGWDRHRDTHIQRVRGKRVLPGGERGDIERGEGGESERERETKEIDLEGRG
jgi:hypothetical protein